MRTVVGLKSFEQQGRVGLMYSGCRQVHVKVRSLAGLILKFGYDSGGSG